MAANPPLQRGTYAIRQLSTVLRLVSVLLLLLHFCCAEETGGIFPVLPKELILAGVSTYNFGNTVSPAESFSSQRTRTFPFACGPVSAQEPTVLSSDKTFPGGHLLVTRGPEELYLLGGVSYPLAVNPSEQPLEDPNDRWPPYLAKINTRSMAQEWRQNLTDTPLDFLFSGALLLLRGDMLLASFSNRVMLLSPIDGRTIKEAVLPTPEGGEVEDVSFATLVILSDGTIVSKSVSSTAPNSTLVVVDGETLEVRQVVPLGTPVGARHTSTVHNGFEYVYIVEAAGNIRRYLYKMGRLWRDEAWRGASVLVPGMLDPRGPTAPVPMNGWILASTNSALSRQPMAITAVWQDDPSIVHKFQPFEGVLPPPPDNKTFISFSATQVAVDPATNTVVASDYIAGRLAVYRLTASGFETLWTDIQYNLDFPVLLGRAGARVLVAPNVTGIQGTPQPMAVLGGAYLSETLIFRNATTGTIITQSPQLSGLTGVVPHVPGYDGAFFYLSTQRGILTRVSYNPGSCKSNPAS